MKLPRAVDRRAVLVVALSAGLVLGCGSAPTASPTTVVSTPEASVPTVVPQGSPALSADPIAATYEAVFLRLNVADGSPQVLAIGVDADGREREIARLAGAWLAYPLPDGGYLAPIGAVSESGLLAIPVRAGDSEAQLPTMRWEIFDLRQPEAAPIVVPDIEQRLEELGLGPYLTKDPEPSVHWAAGERLGIPWHSCDSVSCGVWAFFDGRSGEAIPRRPHAEASCRTRDQTGADVTLFDGGVVRRDAQGTSEEVVPSSGIAFACLAPNDSMIAYGSGQPPSSPVSGVIGKSGKTFPTEGNFAGWLGTEP
jgi:hypothetical protein